MGVEHGESATPLMAKVSSAERSISVLPWEPQSRRLLSQALTNCLVTCSVHPHNLLTPNPRCVRPLGFRASPTLSMSLGCVFPKERSFDTRLLPSKPCCTSYVSCLSMVQTVALLRDRTMEGSRRPSQQTEGRNEEERHTGRGGRNTGGKSQDLSALR